MGGQGLQILSQDKKGWVCFVHCDVRSAQHRARHGMNVGPWRQEMHRPNPNAPPNALQLRLGLRSE